jgi:hypothetical protein
VVIGREDDGCDEERASEGAATGFIDTGNPRCSVGAALRFEFE